MNSSPFSSPSPVMSPPVMSPPVMSPPVMSPPVIVPTPMSPPASQVLGSPIVQPTTPSPRPIQRHSTYSNINGYSIGNAFNMSPAAGKPFQAPSPSIGKSPVPVSTNPMEIDGYNIESNIIHNQYHLDPAPFPEN